jgi:hypothetical protein
MRWLFVAVIFLLIPAWRIVKRAGMNPALSLLLLLPVVNVIALWLFAFAEWPALKQQGPPAIPAA